MNYRFSFYGILWSGDTGTWSCEKTHHELIEMIGSNELDDNLFDALAKKMAGDFRELIDYSVDSIETRITQIKLMSDEHFEIFQRKEEEEY